MKMISPTLFLNFIFLLPSIFTSNFKCVKDGFFPDEKDCWLYHICVGNSHSVKACKDDLLFNPVKNECDWAMNVNCTRTSPDDVLPSNHNLSIAGERASGIVTSESIFEYLCQTVDNDYIAHPTECKRYAYCANGVPQPKTCSRSLYWSQSEKMCVWPAQSDCPAKHISPTVPPQPSHVSWHPAAAVPSTYPSSYILTDAPPPLPSANVYRPSILCPPDRSWRVPDPHDCSIYHDCYHGKDLVSYCPAQLQYNREKQTCDHAVNVQCENKCTNENDQAKFVDLTSCCHYYQCSSGRLMRQACSHPHSFDIQTRTCLPYKRVKCDGRRQCLSKCHYLSNYEVGKSLCEFVPSCSGHSDGYYLDRTKPNCQSYIHCSDYRLVNQSRCSHGQRFNRNTGRCAPSDQVPCRASHQFEFSSLVVLLVLLIFS